MAQNAKDSCSRFFTEFLWSLAKISILLSSNISNRTARRIIYAGIMEKLYLWGASGDLEMHVVNISPCCECLTHTLQYGQET